MIPGYHLRLFKRQDIALPLLKLVTLIFSQARPGTSRSEREQSALKVCDLCAQIASACGTSSPDPEDSSAVDELTNQAQDLLWEAEL